MKEVTEQLLKIIIGICENNTLVFSKDLIIELNNSLQKYTDEYLQQININLNRKEKDELRDWIEMLSDCMNAVKNRDKVLFIDTLQYAMKPFIEKNYKEINS